MANSKMLQFKKPIYLRGLPYGQEQIKAPFLMSCRACLSKCHMRTLFLILFSFVTCMDSSVSHAAEGPADELVDSTSRKRRSRSPSAPATAPAVADVQGSPPGDMPGPVLGTALPPPVAGTPGGAADPEGRASGDERDPKRMRVKGPSASAAADAPPAIVLSPGMFNLTSLDAEPLKKGLVAHCLTEISGNRVGATLLRILGEQLGQYHGLIRAYSEAITQLKPHATDAFFANLNRQITEISASATSARGSAASRGGRAGRIATPQSRFTTKVETLQKLIGDEVAAALTSFLASPAVVSIISRDETCFNYIGSIPLFQSHGNLRIGNLCIHLDFNKIHVFGGQPSSLTSCLGGINPQNGKVEVGMHFAPYYLTIAHELIHTKHFLQSIGADIEYATQSVRRICEACVARGSTVVGLRDVFPEVARGEAQRVPLEKTSYLQALKITDYDARVVAEIDFKFLEQESRRHQLYLSEAERVAGRQYQPLWNNLEERRTVVGPDSDGISELTLRLAARIPMRYLYQDTDRHLFEDPEIINGILGRNNTEQVIAIFNRITLDRVLEVSREHAAAFIFKRFYALV